MARHLALATNADVTGPTSWSRRTEPQTRYLLLNNMQTHGQLKNRRSASVRGLPTPHTVVSLRTQPPGGKRRLDGQTLEDRDETAFRRRPDRILDTGHTHYGKVRRAAAG